MYFIRDAEGDGRGRYRYATLDEAVRGFGNDVGYSTEDRPQEFPFSIIDDATGNVCLVIDLPR